MKLLQKLKVKPENCKSLYSPVEYYTCVCLQQIFQSDIPVHRVHLQTSDIIYGYKHPLQQLDKAKMKLKTIPKI